MLAELDLEGFTLESMNPASHATPASVAAHALYEQADPFSVEEPAGTLHLADARYQAVDTHRTRVSGARFEHRARPTLKIEGARPLGARAVLLAGIADPTLLGCLPQVLAAVTDKVRTLLPGDWQVVPHVYGQGAVRPLAPALQARHEAGLVMEFIAADPGRVSTAGNLAFAFTPSELDAHHAYGFVLYHVMDGAPLEDIFRIATHDIVAASTA
jgi:hypothetical protein